jgi:hypothetical protein
VSAVNKFTNSVRYKDVNIYVENIGREEAKRTVVIKGTG